MLLGGNSAARPERPTDVEGEKLAPVVRIPALGGIGHPALIATIAATLAGLLFAGSAAAATINVTTTLDLLAEDDLCSAREAVNAANDNAPQEPGGAGPDCPAGDPTPDTIVLDAATYGLTGANGDDANASGDLDIDADPATGGPLTIAGQSEGATEIDAQMNDRGIHLLDGVLEMQELTLTGGSTLPPFTGSPDGGGIRVDGGASSTGHMTLEAVTVSGNTSAQEGGGIVVFAGAAQPSLTLTGATVTGNEAQGTFGGGGVYVQGALTATDSEISLNETTSTATAAHGGGIELIGPGTITGSEITGNIAGDASTAGPQGGFGGGIHFEPTAAATLAISDSAVSNNTAERVGGGIVSEGGNATLDVGRSEIDGNSAESGVGGGMHNFNGSTLLLDRSVVSANTASSTGATGGAGINNSANTSGVTATITNSVIAGNASSTTSGTETNAGAGIRNTGGILEDRAAHLTVARSTIAQNTLGGGNRRGGGLAQIGTFSTARIVNSTISGNTAGAGEFGGGINRFGNGGHIELINATVKDNVATDGSGVSTVGNSPGITGDISFANTVFDETDSCAGLATNLVSAGNNIATDAGTQCDFDPAKNDLGNQTLMLGLLADNGGPPAGRPGSPVALETHSLGPTSPAFDFVEAGDCLNDIAGGAPTGGVLATDQRGLPRPFGAGCDAGAFEYRDTDGDMTEDGMDPDDDGDGIADGADNCQFVANPGQTDNDSDGLGNACDPTPDGPPPPPPAAQPPAQTSTTIPSNAFDLGKFKRKTKKGIGFLIVFVPGPGEVGLAGKGIKNRGLAATATKSVATDGGRVKLKVKPAKKGKGRKIRDRLRTKGKAKVKVFVTYLPNGGTANTQKKKLKLIRK